MRQEINDFYQRYAGEQGISFDQAKKKLSEAEMREWRLSLSDYVAEIKEQSDSKMRAQLQADLDARAYTSRIDRLDALVGQVDIIADDLYLTTNQRLGAALGETYERAYYRRWYDLQQRVGSMFSVAGIDERMIEQVLSYPWSGADFSARLWHNKQNLVDKLSEILTQGLIRGESPAVMAKDLADQLGVNYKQASRVVRTEVAHIHNEADAQVEREAGIEFYEYVATLDERTCSICGALDGQVFPTEERQEGSNAPLKHPNCRCVTVEHDPEEYLDWEAIGEPMPQRMTWSEWIKEQGVEDAGLPSDELSTTLEGTSSIYTTIVTGYQFSGGTTAPSEDHVRAAAVYVGESGIEAIYPVDYDRSQQLIEPERAVRLLDELPRTLQEQVLKVELVDYRNPQDAYWAQTYGLPEARTFAGGADGTIFMWANNGMDTSDGAVRHAYAHEAAHTLDQVLGAALEQFRVSESAFWQEIMAEDEVTSGRASPTDYGALHPREDFADSVAEYVRDPEGFMQRYPRRAAYLKEVLA